MARDRHDDSASSAGGGQSDRPSLEQRQSDSQSDTTSVHQQQHHPQQQQQRHHQTKQSHQKHLHHVGRPHHARVPSSKALHKQHGPPGSKLTRRITSPPSELTAAANAANAAAASQRLSGSHSHRRAVSEVKLPRASSGTNLPKSLSHTSLKPTRSHVDIGKRSKSSEKLKRTASGSAIHRAKHAAKTTVHFDLGDDAAVDDEWVDASGSNSPYLSRKGSINSSAQSSAHPNSRPETPNDHHGPDDPGADDDDADEPEEPQPSTPERERLSHRHYLTSRLLQRTPSHGAPPQMTADTATGAPALLSPSPGSTDQESSGVAGSSGRGDELTSRFVAAAGSGVTSEGSFSQHGRSGPRRSGEMSRRPLSAVDLSRPHDGGENSTRTESTALIEPDNSALVPRPGRRSAAPPAETSRIQQKLNLQRASSVIEPGQTVNGATGVVGPSALIGVGGPGYDGGNSRDPRVGKLLERTGMEYLVVRRYQNPISRSLRRLQRLPDADRSKRIPRTNTASTNGKRSVDLPVRHVRNVSMPDPRRPVTPRQGGSVRANGTGSSFDGEHERGERLSGSSLVGGAEEDGTAALLRNLWDKSMDLSASTD